MVCWTIGGLVSFWGRYKRHRRGHVGRHGQEFLIRTSEAWVMMELGHRNLKKRVRVKKSWINCWKWSKKKQLSTRNFLRSWSSFSSMIPWIEIWRWFHFCIYSLPDSNSHIIRNSDLLCKPFSGLTVRKTQFSYDLPEALRHISLEPYFAT